MYENPRTSVLPPVFLNSHNRGFPGRTFSTSQPVSGTIGTANRMIYVPFEIRRGITVYRHFWVNGATASTDNVNVAVYDTAFNRISIGTNTVSSGASVCQFDNVTDYELGPGRYYMALWCAGVTATFLRAQSIGAGACVYYETNASGPQTTGTPAAPAVQNPLIPLFGLALRATDP